MYNYDVEAFLKEGQEVYGLRGTIEKAVDEVCANGVSKVVLTGVGGTIFELMSIKCIFDKYSTYDCILKNGAELLVEQPDWIDDHTVVITGSKSGDTPETVQACKYCKERGAKVIALVGTEDCPLAEYTDYPIVSPIPGMTHTYFKFNLIALRMIYNHGEFDQYEKYADQCKDLYSAVVAIQEKFEPKAEEIAQKYSKAPYQMWIGSGIVWGEINMFTMCILEEMQWMRTRAATSADFFHGVLELVEKDVLKIKRKVVKKLTNLHAKRMSDYIEATYYKEEYSKLKKLSLEVTLIRIFLASLDDTVLKIVKDALKD